MPRSSDVVKAVDLRRAKSRAKVIEWETRAHSRGVRDVPVEVSVTASQPKPRKRSSRRPRAEISDALQGETAPQPMDINETFWMEDPVAPTSKKRVRHPAFPSSAKPHISPRRSTPTLKNLSLRLALTYAASSIRKAFRQPLHARAASLLRSSGGALTVFLHSCSVRSAAESRTSYFLFTEFKNGWEDTSCHHGCGRLECACNLGTLGAHALIKLCAIKPFTL
jgi:hypothetical protein